MQTIQDQQRSWARLQDIVIGDLRQWNQQYCGHKKWRKVKARAAAVASNCHDAGLSLAGPMDKIESAAKKIIAPSRGDMLRTQF